jgi:hypothetical protein
MATTAFLLEGTTTLPNAEAIAAQLMGGGTGGDDDNNNNKCNGKEVPLVSSTSEESPAKQQQQQQAKAKLGSPMNTSPVEISVLNPRGKFQFTFHQHGLIATTIKNPQSIVIPAGVVAHVILFPKPQDCQKVKSSSSSSSAKTNDSSPMVLLCFYEKDDDDDDDASSATSSNGNDDNNKKRIADAAVTFKDKPLSQICFPLPASCEGLTAALEQIGLDHDNNNNQMEKGMENAWVEMFCHSLDIPKTNVYRVPNPCHTSNSNTTQEWTFKSHQPANTSSTTGGMPFVKCYHGVQDGCLFPLVQGLLFFK